MNRILGAIKTLGQHFDELATGGEAYRPVNCPHCQAGGLWRHGFYRRKADHEAAGDVPRELVPIARFLCNPCGVTCSRLPACVAPRRWYGWDIQQVVSGEWSLAHWLAHIPPQADPSAEGANVREQLQHMQRRKGIAYDVRYPFQRPSDGKQVWLRDYGHLRRDAAGRPVELVGLVVDMTDAKRLQDELYRNASSLQQTTEITDSGTWSADYILEPLTMFLSDKAHAILGLTPAPNGRYSLEEMRRNRAATAMPECTTESLRQYHSVHSGLSDRINIVSPWRRPDTGALIWTHTTGKVRRDVQGQLIEMVGVLRDVTKEKEYELDLLHAKEAAEIAVRTQRDFLANMSHEVRTPLNAIIGLSGNRGDKITIGPKRWQAALEEREVLAQRARTGALDLFNETVNAVLRVHINKQMHMIWHHFELDQICISG